MGKTFDELSPDLQAWIAEQKIFFVATAPESSDGHVNCSPKGGDTFRVTGPREVAYLDLTGSGVETIAHLQENRRIVIMFCAFVGPPRIVRLHGQGEVVYPTHPEYVNLSRQFPPHLGTRAIIRINVTRISDSCGYSVPHLKYVGDRDVLDRWTEKKGAEGLIAYRHQKNRTSIDGIPGFKESP